MKPAAGNEAFERLRVLLDDPAPVEPAVFSRLVQTLVRRAGPEGEHLFGERLVRERSTARAVALVGASVGALGVRAVGVLRDLVMRWSKDEPRVEAAANVLGHLGTSEAHEILCRLESRPSDVARGAVTSARLRIESAHPTRYRLLPRLKELREDPESARALASELREAADNELVPLLMDAWDGLGTLARRVVLSVMEARGDSLAGHLIQGEIETAESRELLVLLCKSLRGILERHPQSAQGYESLWQSIWSAEPPEPEVLETAAAALTANPDPELVALYREFLKSPSEAVRLLGLQALAAVPDPSAQADLVRSLESASEEEMAGALEALAAMGAEETLDAWARTSDPARRRGVARVCLRTLRPDLWASLAADRDATVAETALRAWEDAPAGARPRSRDVVPLIKGSPADQVFQRACRILASIGDAEAVPVLAKCLKKTGTVRTSALRTLKALRLRQVFAWPRLGATTQTAILRAMEDPQDPEALSLLSTLAMDLSPHALARVRETLQKTSTKGKKPDADDPVVQDVAEMIYSSLLEKIDAKARKEFAAGEIRRLIEVRPSRADQLSLAVRRVAALWCKPEMGLDEDLSRNVEAFMSEVSCNKTTPQYARRDAIVSLGKSGGPEAVASIMGLLTHPVAFIAEAALEAVETLHKRNPAADLARVRSSQDVRAQAVLVVEDEPAMRALYQNFLNRSGVATLGASDGEEALRAIETKGVGVVILDLDMPRVSGFDVLTALKAKPVRPPVIVVTGKTDQGSIVRAHSLGAVEFLRKPVDLLELLDRVRRAAPWEMPLLRPPDNQNSAV